MMTDWSRLGIAPTTDAATIKKAYHTLLAETNPEDSPEAFMALRQAYESAMEYARNGGRHGAADTEDLPPDQTENPSFQALYGDLLPESHPAHRWTKKLQALYLDFFSRIRPESWEELFSDPICRRIDTVSDAEDALLRMLMEWWFLPDSVIRVMNGVFDFEGNASRLFICYPEDFVQSILLDPLHRDFESFEYTLFEGSPDSDYDGYINLYYTLTGQVSHGEQDAAWDTVSRMEQMDVQHPYLAVEKAKLYLMNEQYDLAAAVIETVYPAFDCSPVVCCMAGEVLLEKGSCDDARARFARALEVHSESVWARTGLAESYLRTGDYDEAESQINEVLARDRYNPRGKALEEEIQQKQKALLLKKAEDGTADPEEKVRLAILCIDTEEYEPAAEILSDFHAENRKTEAERLHFLATALLNLEEAEAAETHFRTAEGLLQTLLEVTSDQEEKRYLDACLCRTMVMRSVALESLNRMEEALTAVTNAAVDHPDQNMVFCRKAELHYEMKQFQESVDAASRSIELDPSFHLPYRIRANAFYELGYYNEAYRDCNDCIRIFDGDIEAYFCRINILIEVNEIQAALQELDSLETQVQGTKITFLRGKAMEKAGETEKAREAYLKVLAMDADKGRDFFYPAELNDLAGTYFRLYQTLRKLYRSSGIAAYRRESMKYLREGVERFPDDSSLATELAGALCEQSCHREEQELY